MRCGRTRRPWLLAVAILALLAPAGCAKKSSLPTGVSSIPVGLDACGSFNVLRPIDFPEQPRNTNRWYPLVPGMQFVLEGRANRGGGPLPHRVVFTVTDLTKVINGVRTVVLWDIDINNNVLSEAELAFHAQDNAGNSWNLGEYPEEYEAGQFVGAPNTWIAGIHGAEAGILVPHGVNIGETYLQGFAPDINFLDCGMTFTIGKEACVPVGCFTDLLEVDEDSPLEPGSGHQRKFYAEGVGNILIGAVNDPEGETLVLAELIRLTPEALAFARSEALRLEAHAYQVSDTYRNTSPMELPGSATRSVASLPR